MNNKIYFTFYDIDHSVDLGTGAISLSEMSKYLDKCRARVRRSKVGDSILDQQLHPTRMPLR